MAGYEKFFCTSCGKVSCDNGFWYEVGQDAPADVIQVLCPNCSQKRFPQFYNDFEKPKESFAGKILNGFFRWNGKKQKE